MHCEWWNIIYLSICVCFNVTKNKKWDLWCSIYIMTFIINVNNKSKSLALILTISMIFLEKSSFVSKNIWMWMCIWCKWKSNFSISGTNDTCKKFFFVFKIKLWFPDWALISELKLLLKMILLYRETKSY